MEFKEGHVYYITFEDTIKHGTTTDTLTTKNYTLIDSTANLTLIDKSTEFGSDVEGNIIDGFRLTFLNDSRVTLDTIRARWTDPTTTQICSSKIYCSQGNS